MIRLIAVCFLVFFNCKASNAEVNCRNAVKRDSTSGKIVLYVFTGSDWCTNCKRLEKQVLKDSAFLKAIEAHHIKIEYLDFPQRKKLPPETVRYNAGISERFGFSGTFPTLVLTTQLTGKFKIIYYTNENAVLFSNVVINTLKKLNE